MQEIKGLRLPKLISDGMVLQRNEKIRIWGYANPNTSVNLHFLKKEYQTRADEEGKWIINMEGLGHGGPHEMKVTSEGDAITIHDVYIGDVWLASGQSNMELPISRVYDAYREELYDANNPCIRQFKVVEHYDFNGPLEDVAEGAWTSVNPKELMDFSALGYFFAKNLYERYRVPIGILNASKGGSPVEAWLSEESIREYPHHAETLNRYKEEAYRQKIIDENEKNMNGWYHKVYSQDIGLNDAEHPWYGSQYDDSDWSAMSLPADFSDYGLKDFNGVIWFRKEFSVPASMVGKAAKLWLGTIRDADDAYVNGIKVGDTGYQYPPRKYEIPPDLLKEGVNHIAIRVLCDNGMGRFAKGKPYRLFIDGDPTKPMKVRSNSSSKPESLQNDFDAEVGIDLSGEWKYKISLMTDPKPGFTFIEWKPVGLYNAMIAPLHLYAIKGAIWYQGESNVGRSKEYRETFPRLIKEWRGKWGLGNFPFLYVQLVDFLDDANEAVESEWAKLRDSQTKALEVTNTAMIVGHDLGEWNDLHPLNKKELGYRLSLAARKLAYEEELTYSGPILKSIEVKGNKCHLSFEHVGGGLVCRDDGPLGGFEVMGEKGFFIKANACIEGDKVVVWEERVKKPLQIRYAWKDVPEDANLYNKEGLPASCFNSVVR